MVMIDVGDPKMAREMLCSIQTQIDVTQMPSGESHIARIEKMIDQLDAHRPLGPDGKHGDLHTETCGCENISLASKIHETMAVMGTPVTYITWYPCSSLMKHSAHRFEYVGIDGITYIQECPGLRDYV